MKKSLQDLLDVVSEKYAKEKESRFLEEVEDFWQPFIQQMARMLDLGAGPQSTLEQAEFTKKIRDLTAMYESIYTEIMAGRSLKKDSNGE